MIKSTCFLLLTLITSQGISQSGDYDIKFDHEWSLMKFFNKHVSGKETYKFAERSPYVHSGTVDLTIDLEGKILEVDFIEKNEKDDMNTFFKHLAMDTDGLWKPMNVPDGVDTMHVIIPILYRTQPVYPKDDRPDLIKKFQEYHNSLKTNQLEVCKDSLCVILPEVSIISGPRVR